MAQPKVLPREQLVQLIVGMLQKRGPAMAAELERRIDVGEGLEVRGVKVDVRMLQEALERYDAEQPAEGSTVAASSSTAPTPQAASPQAASPQPAAAFTGQRWSPREANGGPSSAGGRWTPGTPSASLLAARALQECEQAEVFNRTVQVAKGGGPVAVLSRPDPQSELTGEVLADDETAEVVARFASQKDGKVYLRLKFQAGWISTRSRADLSKAVLVPLPNEAPLEPKKWEEPLESTALRLLPLLDAAAAAAATAAATAAAARAAAAAAAAVPPAPVAAPATGTPAATATHTVITTPAATRVPVDAGTGAAADDAPATTGVAAADEEDIPLTQDTEDGVPPTPEGEHGEGEEEEVFGEEDWEEEEDEEDLEEAEAEHGAEGGPHVPGSRGRRFKVVLGRIPVLSAPSFDELMATGHAWSLHHREEFIADGAVHHAAEGRVYLRLRNGRGWVCEQARNDLRRAAIVPVTRRKCKLSKKMAKAVAFRGGDTDGLTRLKKEDLVKNSHGRIVSRRASEASKKRYENSSISRWSAAVKRARKEMGLAGFVAVKKGTPVYEKAREFYNSTAPQPAE